MYRNGIYLWPVGGAVVHHRRPKSGGFGKIYRPSWDEWNGREMKIWKSAGRHHGKRRPAAMWSEPLSTRRRTRRCSVADSEMLTQTAVCFAPLFARRDCGDLHTRTGALLMCPDVLLSAADVNVKWGRRGDLLFWWYKCSVNKHSYHCLCVSVCVRLDAVVSWSHQNNLMTVL